jgi:hypothetical protein
MTKRNDSINDAVNDSVYVNNPDLARRASVKGMSWGAIIAGALVALMTTLLLTLLFAGIGLSNLDPASDTTPLQGLGTGSVVAVVVTNLLALFVGGWVTGRLARLTRRSDSFLHGILTWTVLTLLTIFLVSSAAGRLVGGVTNLLGNTLSTATQSAAAAAPDSANALTQLPGVDALQSQVDQFLEQAGVQNPEQAGQELIGLVTERVQQGESLTSPEAQEELTTFLTDNSELTEAEIETQVQEFGQQVDQAQQQVVETTEEVAGISGTAALGAFAALLIGAVIAALGAAAGTPKDTRLA